MSRKEFFNHQPFVTELGQPIGAMDTALSTFYRENNLQTEESREFTNSGLLSHLLLFLFTAACARFMLCLCTYELLLTQQHQLVKKLKETASKFGVCC